ncbi:MAG: permease-like cell division protein FtsX [Actinomycetota bacterium]|nr:permease-like cell division protein FtsX [Actinomycetota bacterium]
MSFRPFYFLRESLISFKKNWVISIAAITTVALSLLVIGFFMLVAFTINSWMKMTEQKVEIVAFLVEGIPAESIEALQSEIMSWPEVKRVVYVSKEEALERLKKEFKDSDIISMVEENLLPVSLEISLKDPQKADTVYNRLKGRPEIDDIRHDRKMVERLLALTRTARWIGIVFASLLAFASLVLIANAIRLAIYARRKEVAIMRLVGASNWFIRWPFLLEGILQGLIGALVAILLLYVVQVAVVERIKEVLVFLPIGSSHQEFFRLVIGLLVTGIAMGAAGSTMALRRYLRV